jgi:polyhydroxyalkanoate synthesis repressor PhaR
MTTARIITKYPNRRLYDTKESRYITLADVRNFVLEGVEIVVSNKRSGDDITWSILLQVISDEEQQLSTILSRGFLAQIIRCRDKARPESIAHQLNQCLQDLMAQTQNLATNESNTNFNAHSKKTLTSGP